MYKYRTSLIRLMFLTDILNLRKLVETCNMNFAVLSFHLLLCSLLISDLQVGDADSVCATINCGKGTCQPSLIGFDCECDPGWKKIQIGPLAFPSCVVPNCTFDFSCGKGSAPPPPPPPPTPIFPPPMNLLDPCIFIWCGDGTCNTNGTGYTCECNEGSGNLLNQPGLACFKQCYFEGDCKGFASPPPPSSSSSPLGNGEVPNCSRIRHALSILVLAAILSITWF